MLDVGGYAVTLDAGSAAAACPVVLPDWLRANFTKRGMAPTGCNEARRYPRYHLRGHEETASLHCLPTLPAVARLPAVWPVYMLNISRGGVGFLHFEQLFPSEQARLVLPGGVERLVQVVRCRRLGSKCYAIGARLPEELSVAEMRRIVAEPRRRGGERR